MFLAVTARPRDVYNFDGKIGLWAFTAIRKARRSDTRTGTIAGETDIIQSVVVNAAEYRNVMLKKNGVFDAMRTKMWWFRRGSGQPEAGKTLYYQHDGARAHTAKINQQHWSRHGSKAGFRIEVVTQPAQSPDLNCNDLAFFTSLQSDTDLVIKKSMKDLVTDVEHCWNNYPTEHMESVWRVLFASFKGILSCGGENRYSHHTGSRTAHAKSDREGERHDRSFPRKDADKATLVRDSLTECIEENAECLVSDASTSESDACDSDEEG